VSKFFRRKSPPLGGFPILVIGSGGREFAIIWKLIHDRIRNSAIGQIFCAPGNGGTAGLEGVTNVDISATDIPALIAFAKAHNIYLTIVGPEDPLIMGIVDAFQAEGLRIFGPNKACARLEGEKDFAKDLMVRAGVLTAEYQVFTEYDKAVAWLNEQPEDKPWAVKVPGPALGKGALMCANRNEAIDAVRRVLVTEEFKEAGYAVIIEEYLEGYEVSLLAICSGQDVVALKPAKDYKREGYGDTGENTGGTGNASPHPKVTEAMLEEYLQTIVKPILNELGNFVGVLFVGLMVSKNWPFVLEFNVRFGDPEIEVILALMESDLFELLDAAVDGCLAEIEVEWKDKKALAVALMSPGYPRKYAKGKKISLPETFPDGVTIIHGGTKLDGNSDLITNGGRVLYVVVVADSFEEAIAIAYQVIGQIEVEGGWQYRTDIGADCLLAA